MNTVGTLFRISIFGESHGPCVGLCIDGLPPGIPLEKTTFKEDMARRKAGGAGSTARIEDDKAQFLSGLYKGHTSGSPLCIIFPNQKHHPEDYDSLAQWPRPGHADFTASKKFGPWNDSRGGGHFSGRLTAAIVAAGAFAKYLLRPCIVSSNVIQAGGSDNIDAAIESAAQDGDSVGALVALRVSPMHSGLGEPYFDSTEGMIARMLFAVPGVRGVEFGDGFRSAAMRGSAHNDPIVSVDGKTAKNGSGGINGGISNGNDLAIRVAIKPPSSIRKNQTSINLANAQMESHSVQGRHDVCFAPRAAVALEASVAIVLADLLMQEKARHSMGIAAQG